MDGLKAVPFKEPDLIRASLKVRPFKTSAETDRLRSL